MKKGIRISLKVFQAVLILFTVIIMAFTILSVKNLNKRDQTSFFGYKFFIVLSDSMKPEFQAGDIVISKIINPDNLQTGDIITFYSSDPNNFRTVITHQITGKTMTNQTEAFITKGINVNQNDEYPAMPDNIIGKYQFSIPKAGLLFNFIKTPIGYFTLIFCPFMILILINGTNILKLIRKKHQEEIAELKQEKLKNQEMLDEIKILKEKLETGNNGEAH